MIATLTTDELAEAVAEGNRRQAECEQRGSPNRYGATGGARIHRLGAAGELVFCKAMSLEWTGKQNFRGSDASGWEVRTTTYPNGCLIVHKEDLDDARYALVIPTDAARLTYNIVGYKLGRDAKNQEWWRTDRPTPAFFVPQNKLIQL